MLPTFLVPETVVHENGEASPVPLGDHSGLALQFTLGITAIIEQESLDVTIWGSPGSANWGVKPLLSFPQKFYAGLHTMLLAAESTAPIVELKVRWKVSRWGHGTPRPMFRFYVFAEQAPLATAG